MGPVDTRPFGNGPVRARRMVVGVGEEAGMEWWQWVLVVVVVLVVLTALFAWIQARRRRGGVRTTKR